MNRRDVLRAAAALPAIFGLCGCSRSPSWFGEALRKIRTEGKPGLVLRLPKDATLRCGYGHQLAWLMSREDVAGLEVSLRSVLLCLEEDDALRLLYGARDGEDLLLIDGDGRVLDGRAIDPRTDFAEQAGELLEGRGLARLKAARDEAAGLILKRREGEDVAAAILALPRSEAMPYGASIQMGASRQCAENPQCFNGTCGACGLAVITSRSREFVKFLAK